MSSYYDERRTSTKDRRRGDDDYYDETMYTNTRENQRSTALVKRRDSPDYADDDRRDYSPGGGYYRETTIRKSGTRPAGRARSHDQDDRYDERSFADSRRDSYYSGSRRRPDYDDRRGSYRSSRYDRYSDYSSRSRSRTPPRRERRKSMPEEALEAIGLGGLASKFLGNKDRSRSGSRDRRSRSRGGRDKRSSSEHRKEQMQQALKAAVLAGAASAFRARHEEGGWKGDKGRRVLTAALAAGGANGFINRDKDPESHKLRDTVGSAVAGIATDRLVNGRSRSRGPNSRPGSPDRGGRSRSRSKAGDLLAGGAIAAAAKKIADSVRGRSQSRDRGRGRSRSRSYDSYDSRSPPKRSRSRSVIARGLSKVGLNSQADRIDPAGARERSRSRGARSRSRSRYADDDYVDDHRSSLYDPPNYNGRGSVYDNRDVGTSHPQSRALDPQTGAMISRPHSVGPGGGLISPPPPDYHYDTAPRHNGDPETDSDSDLGSSSEDEKKVKKGRKRMAISGGLATVATIHAGHSVYQSMEKREARKRAVRDGTITKEDAAKHKNRDRLQDAASVGLAALGIKGAYSEWKEMKETMDEHKEVAEKKKRHAQKREARRQKLSMVGMNNQYSNSAPTLSDPFYAGNGHDEYGRQQMYHGADGPYMSGANAEYQDRDPYMNGASNTTQYFDDNPYGWASGGQQQQQQQQQYPQQHQQYPNNGTDDHNGGSYHTYNNGGYYPPPPAAGGTGFPPPPGSQPPPPQGV